MTPDNFRLGVPLKTVRALVQLFYPPEPTDTGASPLAATRHPGDARLHAAEFRARSWLRRRHGKGAEAEFIRRALAANASRADVIQEIALAIDRETRARRPDVPDGAPV